jgi:N-acetyl-anhydromuramyl-L-alanine amidase AmpD
MPNIVWIGSPNFDVGRDGHKVRAIVLHGTGTPGPLQPGIGDVDSTFAQDGGVSTHFAIDRNGNIHQYVDTRNVAYGNGIVDKVGPDPSVGWLMDNWRRNINPNLETISIETKNDGSNNQPLTEPQYQSLLWLVRKLLAENPQIPLDRNSGILGHYQIQQQGRARCPGPNFPWARLMSDLKSGQQSSPVVSQAQPQGVNKPMKGVDGSDIYVVYPITVAYQQWPWLGLPLDSMASLVERGLPGDGVCQNFERGRVEIRKDANGNYRDPELGVVNSELFKLQGKL